MAVSRAPREAQRFEPLDRIDLVTALDLGCFEELAEELYRSVHRRTVHREGYAVLPTVGKTEFYRIPPGDLRSIDQLGHEREGPHRRRSDSPKSEQLFIVPRLGVVELLEDVP